MTVKLDFGGMEVILPRKGFQSYPKWIADLMGQFIEKKQASGYDRVEVVRVTHQDDPSRLSIYINAHRGPLIYMGVYGGPKGDSR